MPSKRRLFVLSFDGVKRFFEIVSRGIAEEDETNLVGLPSSRQRALHAVAHDARALIHRKAGDAGADRGHRNRAHSMLVCESERIVHRRAQRIDCGAATQLHARRMDDGVRGQLSPTPAPPAARVGAPPVLNQRASMPPASASPAPVVSTTGLSVSAGTCTTPYSVYAARPSAPCLRTSPSSHHWRRNSSGSLPPSAANSSWLQKNQPARRRTSLDSGGRAWTYDSMASAASSST